MAMWTGLGDNTKLFLAVLSHSFHGFGTPPVREGWFPHGGYSGGVRGASFGRKDGLVCANPTF
jgi:hypothetical protein